LGVSFDQFDAKYYEHFYSNSKVHDQDRIDALVTGIMGFAGWWSIPVRSVLDVGAGMGSVGNALSRLYPKVTYRGTEVSAHACKTYGHLRVDIATWNPRRAYDITVCLSVVQYLDNIACAAAIANLAAATKSLLYFEVPTTWDKANVIDESATDMNVHWRTGAWYRKLLLPHFQQVGAGLWLKRDSSLALFELERASL
jgi:hypothetical protein